MNPRPRWGSSPRSDGAPQSSTTMEWLTPDECLALLASVPVGRIVFSSRALPAIAPVNHVVHDGSILIRTGAGSKLAAAVRQAVVAFEADDLDPETRTGWSVVVIGEASRIDDDHEVARLSEVPLRPWGPGRHDHLVRITIAEITGRRITRGQPAVAAV